MCPWWLRQSKNLPAMWKTQVKSLGWGDPLEKGMQPTPTVLPREFHGQRSLLDYSPWGGKEWDMTEGLALPILTIHIYIYVCIYTCIYTIGKLFISITGKDEKYLTITNVRKKFSDTPSKNVK